MSEIPHPAWAALSNPHRFPEVRKAIAADAAGLLAARGPKWNESALHWVAMSDPGSWVDLMAHGPDPNVQDRLGRTPLDWINDRLWMGTMAPHQRLGTPARDRIRVATIKQVPAVWASGGRPGTGPQSQNAIKLWIRAGLWDLLSLAQDEPQRWKNWVEGEHALHAWVPFADRESADALLERILSTGIAVDLPDDHGRTALWMAVDQWIREPAHAAAPRRAIETLRKLGADPDINLGAQSPAQLLISRDLSPQLLTLIGQALGF